MSFGSIESRRVNFSHFPCDFFPPSWLQYCLKEAWLFIRGKHGIFVFLLQTTLADGSI